MTQNSNDKDKSENIIASKSIEPEMSQYDLDQDEKARTFMERGESDYKAISGGGVYAGIYQSTFGQSEEIHEENLKQLARDIGYTFSDIFPPKALPKRKRHREPRSPTPRHDAENGFTGFDKTPPTNITQAQFIELYSAVCFANYSFGVILNTHVTIHWGALGIDDQNEAATILQEQFIHHLKGWMAYKKRAHKDSFLGNTQFELCWIYSHENSPYGGFHTHFLVGIPELLIKDFSVWVNHRFMEITQTPKLHDKAVFIRTNQTTPIKSQWHWFQYLCKGLNPNARVKSHVHTDWLKRQRSEYERQISKRETAVNKVDSTYIMSPPPDDLARHVGKLHTANRDNIISQSALYCSNIIDINTVALGHFIDYQYENPGHIYCKQRVNSSRNLARSARATRSFKSLMEQEIFHKDALYTDDYYKEWLDTFIKSIK